MKLQGGKKRFQSVVLLLVMMVRRSCGCQNPFPKAISSKQYRGRSQTRHHVLDRRRTNARMMTPCVQLSAKEKKKKKVWKPKKRQTLQKGAHLKSSPPAIFFEAPAFETEGGEKDTRRKRAEKHHRSQRPSNSILIGPSYSVKSSKKLGKNLGR